MTAPGWYRAHGDPANTARYWDGQAWQGDAQVVAAPATAPPTQATPASSGGIVYYDAGSTEIDLGDIATQTSLAEQGAAEAAALAAMEDGQVGSSRVANSYAVSPYSVSMTSAPNIKDRRSGRGVNFALMSLASIIVPVVLYLFGVRGPLLWGAIGILTVGLAVGRNKAMTSIWSGMRTTR